MIYLDAIVKLAENLKGCERVSLASGFTASTTIVTLAITRFRPDDYYNGGELYWLTGPNANNANLISDYSGANSVATITPTVSSAAAGNEALIVTNHFSLSELKSALILAALDIGDIPATDDSLTVVEDQSVYTLPNGVSNVYRVEVAANSSDPYGWVIHQGWQEVDGTIEFDSAPSGYTIRLHYRKPLAADMGTLSSAYMALDVPASVPQTRLIWTAVYYATNKYLLRVETDDPAVKELNKQAAGMMMSMKSTHPIRIPQRDPRLSRY